jgi:hypothetical protein
MAKSLTVFLLISVLGLIDPGQSKTGHKPVGANYQIAFASFAPLNNETKIKMGGAKCLLKNCWIFGKK